MNNELQLYDIYEHWHVPFWQTSWFFWTALACGILALVLLLFWVLKKIYGSRSLSPAQEALHDLEKLTKTTIKTREDAQEAYFKLTAIVKKFFQAHYQTSFMGMSDSEMIAALKKTTLAREHIEKLEAVVNESVMVKYARQEALQENVFHAVTESIDLIKHIMIPVKNTR